MSVPLAPTVPARATWTALTRSVLLAVGAGAAGAALSALVAYLLTDPEWELEAILYFFVAWFVVVVVGAVSGVVAAAFTFRSTGGVGAAAAFVVPWCLVCLTGVGFGSIQTAVVSALLLSLCWLVPARVVGLVRTWVVVVVGAAAVAAAGWQVWTVLQIVEELS